MQFVLEFVGRWIQKAWWSICEGYRDRQSKRKKGGKVGETELGWGESGDGIEKQTISNTAGQIILKSVPVCIAFFKTNFW